MRLVLTTACGVCPECADPLAERTAKERTISVAFYRRSTHRWPESRSGPLRQVPARVRFLSVEPLLEDLGPLDLGGIDWVIVGGESGPAARPMRQEWALSVRDRCRAADVAFLFKQWGAWGPDGVRRDQQANGRLLAGRLWDERPESSGALL